MRQVCIKVTSLTHKEWSPDGRNDDWSLDEWNDDWSCVEWHEEYERMCCTSVSSFPLESSERVKANLDTGATVDTFLANFDREGVGDGRFHVWITDVEARQFQGYDENGKPRSPNGRFRDAPQVLGGSASAVRQHLQQHRRLLMYTKVRCSAAEIAYRE